LRQRLASREVFPLASRRASEPRSTPLIFGRDGDAFVVVASLGGSDDHPGWYRNLVANPEASVQVKGERFPLRARTAVADERARLWKLMVGVYPACADYQARTSRELPIIRLELRRCRNRKSRRSKS
jgi:deazaflavin-dependent oxidoreductase (nitroreductase family)